MTRKCPICGKEVQSGSAFFPFCSDRCRLIDLGNWADERYRIAGREQRQEDENDDERD
jgi:endogenous inhibitor of DNA gyrase (YacG/DUF329 family)